MNFKYKLEDVTEISHLYWSLWGNFCVLFCLWKYFDVNFWDAQMQMALWSTGQLWRHRVCLTNNLRCCPQNLMNRQILNIEFSCLKFHHLALINHPLHSLIMLQSRIINKCARCAENPVWKPCLPDYSIDWAMANCERAAPDGWYNCGIQRNCKTWVILWAMVLNNQGDTKTGPCTGQSEMETLKDSR